MLIGLLALLVPESPALAWQDDPAAINLHSTGVGAFEQGEYDLAIDQWNRLLEEYPAYSARLDVRYYVAQSWFNLQDYVRAGNEFRQVLQDVPDVNQFKNGPALLVFLGFSEYSAGRDEKDAERSQALLRDAISRYETFFSQFGEDDLADQALFFHAETLAFLNERHPDPAALNQAIACWQRIIDDFPDSRLRSRTLSELAASHEAAGNLDQALAMQNRLAEEFPDQGSTAAQSLRTAETIRKMGVAARDQGDRETAANHFRDAIGRYTAVADETECEQRDLALFHRGWCQLQIGDFAAAADSYATLARDLPDSPHAAASRLSAGKFHFSAKQLDQAAHWLNQVVDDNGSGADEAAHWLCRVYLEKGEQARALDLARQRTADQGGGDQRANLLMDAGDALHEMPDRRPDSVAWYRRVAGEFPDSPLAPKALYYAAFANMSSGQPGESIRDARRFLDQYPEDDLRSTVQQVLGESALKDQQPDLAEATFRQLIGQFPDHDSADWWRTRVGWALYLQDQHDEAIAWLEPALTEIGDPGNRSETAWVLGSARLANGDQGGAIEALNQALAEQPDRPEASEIRLLLARAHFRSGDSEQATAIASQLLRQQPAADNRLATRYWLGEFACARDDHKAAIENYTPVIEAEPASDLLPDALYGRAWARVKTDDASAAIEDFTRLIEEFPDQAETRQARLGRAVACRGAGQYEEAMGDLDLILDQATDPDDRWQARYERGLCQVGLEQWAGAVDDLQPLAESAAPDHPLTDNLFYELAWACRKLDRQDEAQQAFTRLADEMPESEFASEANYHIAESLYNGADHAAAARRYRQCLSLKPDNDVGERALYKLAWCAFEQQEWDEAHRLFAQQVEQHPEGPLHAVGLSMVAESLFQNQRHADAVTAYKIAIPAIRTANISEQSVRILTPLHAAQSANKTGDHAAALEYSQQVLDDFPDSPYQYAARFEKGTALAGLGKSDEAIEVWEPVAGKSLDKTGARARAMIGEQYFKRGEHDRAIREFKLVIYGYPVAEPVPAIDAWRAFAAYETARCYYVQIDDATGERREQLIDQARQWFRYLVDQFPEDELADNARKQLELLDHLK